MAPPCDNKLFRCYGCGKSYQQLNGLLRHKRTAHGPPAFLNCRRCGYYVKRREFLRKHYAEKHPSHESEVDEIKMSTVRQGRREKSSSERPEESGRQKSDVLKQVDVRRVTCQEAEQSPLELPDLPEIPPCLSPLPPSPPPCSDKAKVPDDDALSVAASMPPLEMVTDDEGPAEEEDKPPTPKREPAKKQSTPTPKSQTAGRRSRPSSPPKTSWTPNSRSKVNPQQRVELLSPRVTKLATVVEHVQTYTYVEGVLIARDEHRRTYYRDALVHCTYALPGHK